MPKRSDRKAIAAQKVDDHSAFINSGRVSQKHLGFLPGVMGVDPRTTTTPSFADKVFDGGGAPVPSSSPLAPAATPAPLRMGGCVRITFVDSSKKADIKEFIGDHGKDCLPSGPCVPVVKRWIPAPRCVPIAPVSPDVSRYRTQMCRYGEHCRKSDCTFAHKKSELRSMTARVSSDASRYRTKMCRYGERCRRSDCTFAHNKSELRPIPVPR